MATTARSKPIIFFIFYITLTPGLRAQNINFPGSTAQGDILRGQGQFLKGAAWYELNSARAAAINTKTAIEINRWNRQVYEIYKQERAAVLQQKANLTQAQATAAKQKYEERERQLRTNPDPDDITRGDALNALLLDLADPQISPSAWRAAQITLPKELSIRSLIFQFATKRGDKSSQSLKTCLIALGQLDPEKWPILLKGENLAFEREAYEKVYKKILSDSLAGKLRPEIVLELDKVVPSLGKKVKQAVPAERGFQASAMQSVETIQKATAMFNAPTIELAQEIIADTSRHEATTVGELLAFMRKYRLLFANVEKYPKGGESYGLLYSLLRQQKEKLGLDNEGRPKLAGGDDRNALQTGSVWVGKGPMTFTVMERNGNQFKARFELPRIIREVNGTIVGDKIEWLGKNTKAIKGNPGDDNTGIIQGNEMRVSWSSTKHSKSGEFVLKRKLD